MDGSTFWGLVGAIIGVLAATAVWMWRLSRVVRDLAASELRADHEAEAASEIRRNLAELEARAVRAEQTRETAERERAVLDDRARTLAERGEDLERELRQLRVERDQLRDDASRLEERAVALEKAEQQLTATFKAAGVEALKENRAAFLDLAQQVFATQVEQFSGETAKRQQKFDELVTPIQQLLTDQKKALERFHDRTSELQTSLVENLKNVTSGQQELQRETNRLVTALRRPETRGRWGELQLRNAVELAGMTRYCDFSEQVQTDAEDSRDRPDMTVNLPGGGIVVVDSKVALDAYLDALEPDADRDEALSRHALQVETHVRRLSNKKYWSQFERTPGVVVMFMPLESALVAALEVKPDLHARAMEQQVLIATPTLLVALLRAIAYGWQQEDIAANAREIARVGRELYDRIRVLTQHVQAVGRSIRQSVDHYNKAVGSVERMLVPSARRLRELGATQGQEVEGPPALDAEPRDFTGPEALPATEADRE